MEKNSKQLAEKKGNNLLFLMQDEGWKLRVWENLGWHYSIQKGGMSIYPTHSGGYSTLFSLEDGSCAGESFWTPHGKTFKDPNKAVLHQLTLARKYIKKFTSECAAALAPFAEIV